MTKTNKIHPHKFAMWVAIGSISMMFAGLTSAYIVRHAQGNWVYYALPSLFTYSTFCIVASSITMIMALRSFKKGMENLHESGLVDLLTLEVVVNKKPFLGICVGMQILSEGSDEGKLGGLGWIEGEVKKFDVSKIMEKPYLPHMGWNNIKVKKRAPLFDKLDADPYFYFVHSYYVVPEDQSIVATVTNYGIEFVSGIQYKNIYAFQFHPEKSQTMGLSLLERFSNLN